MEETLEVIFLLWDYNFCLTLLCQHDKVLLDTILSHNTIEGSNIKNLSSYWRMSSLMFIFWVVSITSCYPWTLSSLPEENRSIFLHVKLILLTIGSLR